MGEAKRRKETDPTYGTKKQDPPKPKSRRFDLKSISKTEWIVWAVLFGLLAATFAWTNPLQ